MIKRPRRGETEEDVLQMQQEFLSEKAKNPKMQPAAQLVKIEKQPKQSLFAKSRQKNPEEVKIPDVIHREIHEKIVGDCVSNNSNSKTITDIVMGDIIEKVVEQPKVMLSSESLEPTAFPKMQKISVMNCRKSGVKSIFAQAVEEKIHNKETAAAEPMEVDETSAGVELTHLKSIYGTGSVIVENKELAATVHESNLEILSKMKGDEIMEERKQLLQSIDPGLLALLTKKRQEKAQQKDNFATSENKMQPSTTIPLNVASEMQNVLPQSNAAVEIIQRSTSEQWMHFDVVEKDKLEWMRDIPLQTAKLKPGEKFEARFDWKGVLLPHSLNEIEKETETEIVKDDRELYLHGEEPHRPGYTLQELFRLARSNVIQQRVTAFGAIAGILNIYQQGFYDQVLELPVTKIFFLLRFGFDDNTPAMLEVVGKALSFLFYNESDETLLDMSFENPGCQWQPRLEVLADNADSDADLTTIEYLQKQMQQLQVGPAAIKANINEDEDESKTSMSDFQLAETDLMDCCLRTNIMQRIYFILNSVRPENSTVPSCLKILIRIARSGKEQALQIINYDDLLNCLFANFLPGLETVDTSQTTPPYYGYPQYLCMKLMRILICSSLSIAVKLINFKLVDKLENYLFNREDIKGKLIKLQIESLRCLRCLLLLRLENNALHKKFLPAFRYMLDWHSHHLSYEEGGQFLIRQHAAAVVAAVASISSPIGSEVETILGDVLHACCCNWFYKATRFGLKEFSQATLLSSCLNAITWFVRNAGTTRSQAFVGKYLCEFINSESFLKFISTISSSSIILRNSVDRRTVHNPLPNVGSVIMNSYGPQLVITETYPIYLIISLWRLMELLLERNVKQIFDNLLRPDVVDSLIKFLGDQGSKCNRYLATNFYAKMELQLVFKLLRFEGFNEFFSPAEMLQMVYNFLCCLTAEHITEIEQLFEHVIFNTKYINVDGETLNKWRQACLELVYPHYIVVPPTQLTLCLPFSQVPILPQDWPYFQLKIILQNYIENVKQNTFAEFSEKEILQMTLNFVTQLEDRAGKIQIASPTEKLMYLMIAFMGPESQFLDKDINALLRQHLLKFYHQSEDVNFQFDAEYEGKCKFENLYALFVDHFQAASYGDELFSSLVMVPLAQKYDNKWRRRVWSDYASALRFLNCDECLLIGGITAYLEPSENEESLIRCYNNALYSNLVRTNTLTYNIARHHVDRFKERLNKKS